MAGWMQWSWATGSQQLQWIPGRISPIFGGHKPSITTYNSFFLLFLSFFCVLIEYIYIHNIWSLQLLKRESMQLIHTYRLGCIVSAFITVFKAEQ